ncbi:MAG: hypothetical protein DI544_15260 [Sphingomonas taxi]|uniref:Uncharacterized protein n=1 Tax=Sphingomonas taxi TaxID=1549858 RepID=A0A2W5NWN5_9SPHN|nr:MAG: hypothetical protein DI544_15260 [Sphingomonas taxi]
MNRIIAVAVMATAFIAPAHAARRSPDAQLAEVLKGRVAEKPVSCITASATDNMQIVTARAIVWRIGRRLYVNVPRDRAETLRADDILITQPFGSQLCRNDQVRPLDRMSNIPRGILLLGDFTPYVRK